MSIPVFPNFIPLELEQREEIHPLLNQTPDGISEFTFSNLYLFRNRYQYKLALLPEPGTGTYKDLGVSPERGLIISGVTPLQNTSFFMIPCGIPDKNVLDALFETHNYWKNIPLSLLDSMIGDLTFKQVMEQYGLNISEDRDNFDYLHLRSDLALLSGRKFHKKKNLVNAFKIAYPNHESLPFKRPLLQDAHFVLEGWKEDKGDAGDYFAAREALEFFSELNLSGAIFYVDKQPVGYCLGETVARGAYFAIHFEKALDRYKGVFQYMNQAFAGDLPESIIMINREQDLGDKGLRQAKMTYRPVDFVKKYRGFLNRDQGSGNREQGTENRE